MALFPPDTNNLDALAAFFDHVDSLALTDVEDVHEQPQTEFLREPELVPISLRLLKEDVEIIKRLAQHEGVPYTTLMRWMLHRMAQGAQSPHQDRAREPNIIDTPHA